jgi:hypothetical protein
LAQRGSGRYVGWYRERPVKITSYTWGGTVSGYGRPSNSPGSGEHPRAAQGGTYKLSQFRAQDILLWEADETQGFNFNDGGNNVANLNEGVSQRHAGGIASEWLRR